MYNYYHHYHLSFTYFSIYLLIEKGQFIYLSIPTGIMGKMVKCFIFRHLRLE
jgi:hypothetical protein